MKFILNSFNTLFVCNLEMVRVKKKHYQGTRLELWDFGWS